MPTVGSLFAGIGGIDLGLERAGWTVRWQVEWDEWCQRVLAKHWPDVPRYGDITRVDWSGVERVDLLAGGFPCQPFSNAGKRAGKSDDRWLWPEFARAIRELRPGLVLVENVPGLLAGHGGMGAVLGDLAALGYDAEWDCVPAAAVGAPHLRWRVWIVAYAQSAGRETRTGNRLRTLAGSRQGSPACSPSSVPYADRQRLEERGLHELGRQEVPDASRSGRRDEALADADRDRLQARRDRGSDRVPAGRPTEHGQPIAFGGDRTYGGRWLIEPDVGRVAHGVPSRVDRLRGLGNAVVPQVVEVIGRRLLEAEGLT